MTTFKGGTSGRTVTTAAGTSGRTTELRAGVNGSTVSANAGINGFVHDVQGGVSGQVYEVDAPPVEASTLIPPAPSFPGMDFVQIIPANLFLSGDLALEEPIDSLPLYGGLIPTGAFTASGTDRPILQEVDGRIGAYHNGFRMLEIDGLALDLTAGHTFFCVKKDESTGNFQGCARFQYNSSPDTTTNSVFEFYNALTGQYAVTNRAFTTLVAGAVQLPRSSFFVLGAKYPSDTPRHQESGCQFHGNKSSIFWWG